MDTNEPASFTRLPAELLLIIIENLDPRDLTTLSAVTIQHNNICRPMIFRKVDLSIHNRGEVFCSFQNRYQLRQVGWYEPSDSLQCNNIPPSMQKRQEAFLSALIKNPTLAEHVEIFSWTLLLLDSNRRTYSEINPFAINKRVALDPRNPFNHIWNVFASLARVRTLDLAWLSRHLAMPLIHNIPPTLFPAATSVRLTGVMPYALAASILLSNPQNLLHLDLDNLQQSGIVPKTLTDEHREEVYKTKRNRERLSILHGYRDDADAIVELAMHYKHVCRMKARLTSPTPTPNLTIFPPHRQKRRVWNNLRLFNSESQYFNAPGPMQNLLGALAGKCTSLTSLRLRKVGARDQFDLSPHCTSKEADIYAEWAFFLASVGSTLECLTIEQGERWLPRVDWVQPPVRPMDQLFGDYIFPVLKDAGRRGWPRMKGVVIEGLQQWREGDGKGGGGVVLVDGGEGLREALGKGVEVVIRRKAGVVDHLGEPYSR